MLKVGSGDYAARISFSKGRMPVIAHSALGFASHWPSCGRPLQRGSSCSRKLAHFSRRQGTEMVAGGAFGGGDYDRT